MSEIKFSLPGPETVTLSGQTIDKLIRAGDGDAALLYLHILKTRGQSASDETAAALGKSPGVIADAMALLSRLGLIKLDGVLTGGSIAAAAERSDAPGGIGAPEEPREYTFEEIREELASGSSFSMLAEEAQNSLGRKLSPDELMRLFGMYDGLRLPAEVILLLITHCISESRGRSGGGRKPTMSFIEKTAYIWEREGIFSLDKAEEYLKALAARASAQGEIKQALMIKGDNELSTSQKKYVDGWIAKGFDAAAVAIAYDRTMLQTGKLAWQYIDAILDRWHSSGIHTAREIEEKDGRPNGNGSKNEQKSADRKFGAPDQEEIRRMERLLKKIKEE